jgi:FkbM family methyltransferase
LILLEDYIKAFIHRLRGLSINSNPININKTREIQFCIRNQTINIVYPADLVSLGLLWEIFGEEVYYFENSVKCIYDLGANIGLSAVYFHLLNPSAEIICVEPLKENLQILERNLGNNNINAKIIRAAVGDTERQTTLFFSDQSHALPSMHTKQPQARQVSMLPFDRIINSKEYGLKIDIEGAERFLTRYPSIIENATWIVGELHYSGNIESDSLIDAFFNLVKHNFIVKKGRPIIYFIGNEVLLCETFKTLKKIPRV